MTKKNIEKAKREALRFVESIDDLQNEAAMKKVPVDYLLAGSRESGAVRRASMDLTRALADLRRW